MSMLNVQIHIEKIRHLLSGVIFRFLPNLHNDTINTMCTVSLVYHLRAVADAFRPVKTHQRY